MSAQDPIAAFRVEAGELLADIEQALLDLTHDLGSRELVDSVFRGLHTLKGSGAMFGFDALATFTHHCETAFDRVRKAMVPATEELVAVILSAMDHMQALVDGDGAGLDAVGDEILVRLQQAIGDRNDATVAVAPVSDIASPTQVPASGWLITFYLPPDAIANGTNPLALLDELRGLGDAKVTALIDRIPPVPELDTSQCHFGWRVELRGTASRSDIEDVFIFVLDDMELDIAPLDIDADTSPECPAQDGTFAAPIQIASDNQVNLTVANPNDSATVSDQGRNRAAGCQSESVRVSAERLDVLMDRVGELVIVQSRLAQLANGGMRGPSGELALRSVTEDIERLASELRDTMMVMRMVSVASLFGRFRRLVHDLSRETGKTIELLTEGETTEVDKTVIERLADPMVHLIRNACDHGLESADDRVASGKAPTGQVKLSAEQAAGEVLITIRDDGRGIDRERVRAKAEAQGLIEQGQPMSDPELLQLIFHPGFSTAAQVTNLSGRGVGMDVVKRTIESLRGTIAITSVPGEGSTVTLRIPLTLAIIDGLLVRVGKGRYVIPLSAVDECIELSLEDDLRSRGRSFVTLRDRLVPFIRLRDMFETGTQPDPHQKIVVITTAGERVGLVVDQIIGSHQTVIKSMSPLHRNVPAFAGATILGDGNVALILDAVQLVSIGQQQEERLRIAG